MNGNTVSRDTWRVIDANINRVREGLRVAEEYARLALGNRSIGGTIAAELRELRHTLATVAGEVFPQEKLLSFRDVRSDPGASVEQAADAVRTGAREVATSALKRSQEALRAIEEFGKLASPHAYRFSQIRYRVYDLERDLLMRSDARKRLEPVRLFVLVTTMLCKAPVVETVKRAIAGGAGMIQLREKQVPDRELVRLASELREICSSENVPLIVDDRADVARAAGADGVHLGTEDLPVDDARKVLGAAAIVGTSTHSVEQARAMAQVADYIGLGPAFATATKGYKSGLHPEVFRKASAEIETPWFAIGGITAETVPQLVDAGVRRVAVCSAVIASADPAAAAANILERLALSERSESKG